ncbi:hypothetical protein [Actinomadura sp. NPDC000600]|uniref:hypothetical protein n=1 Tax=Actinomadura sp. NPDC000600 TaxID=3154262 RepID=UPI003391E485
MNPETRAIWALLPSVPEPDSTAEGVVFAALFAVFAGLLLFGGPIAASRGRGRLKRRRERRKRATREMADLQAAVAHLGEDIARLDLDVADGDLDPDVRADYERAMSCYDRAKEAAEHAAGLEDMEEVVSAAEDSHYYMTATRARLAGEQVPERAPCFFDPEHGPSVQNVVWTPSGGTARSVPACAADAEAVLSGAALDAPMVPKRGGRRPSRGAGARASSNARVSSDSAGRDSATDAALGADFDVTADSGGGGGGGGHDYGGGGHGGHYGGGGHGGHGGDFGGGGHGGHY